MESKAPCTILLPRVVCGIQLLSVSCFSSPVPIVQGLCLLTKMPYDDSGTCQCASLSARAWLTFRCFQAVGLCC
jgi:hypothetical protein